MPSKAGDARAHSIACLSSFVHAKFLAINNEDLLSNLKKALDERKIKGDDGVIVLETWRTFIREKKIPDEFVRTLSETTSKAQQIWALAREKNDFNLFLPWLSKIVELKRREAEYVGYQDSPYDALIDAYEPGMTAKETEKILEKMKDFLVPFLKRIQSGGKGKVIKKVRGKFPILKQIECNEWLSKKVGFDFDAGKIAVSTHPFTSGFHPFDVRFTTRYREDDPLYAIGSTLHEAGHALYEQGLPHEHFGTPLAESVSLGIHESQSRMWENLIGKSRPFLKYFLPEFRKYFPSFQKMSLDDIFARENTVTPSLIRTEADEVTYNLHIIIRFEIEKDMIEGKINLKDLPKIWKEKYKEYLGVSVPSDTLGVLQDVHWSCGLIGYFPTYSFGNLYSAQFYEVMRKSMPDMEKKIEKGDFTDILAWLRKNIHRHGKKFLAHTLVLNVTGSKLESDHFIHYLEKKYSKIYSL